MCGILGIFAAAARLPADAEARLRRAGEAIGHRGPDASGSVSRPSALLGHRRLSILDLSPRSNQPMACSEGTLLLSYNGEIYNFKELRQELEKTGVSFRTTSDTEVLLAGYGRWGLEELLRRCAGMFAFALYDEKKRTLVLARDRAGKKPLYYAEDGGILSFCSEIKGLLQLRPDRPQLDAGGLESYLTLKFVPSPDTLFAGIKKVPPGCYAQAGPGGLRVKRYWTPLSGASSLSYAEALDRVDAALTTAVSRRLVSDVPVCVFLSGGVDSSLIVSKLESCGSKGTASYTVGYSDMPDYNEFDYSRLVARRFAVDYREVKLTAAQVLEVLQDPGQVLDDPVSDWVWVPLHFLSRQARADGFKVVLLGEGSDEVFFGYDVMLRGWDQMQRHRGAASKALAQAAYALGRPIYDIARRGHQRYDLMRRVAKGLPVYMGSSSGFPRTQRHQWAGTALGPEGKDKAGEFIQRLHDEFGAASPDAGDAANLISYIEFYTKMNEVLLHRVDRITMAHSLEARAPFLDQDLVELAFSLPGGLKVPRRRLKGLLKEVALRHLPGPVVDRPKMGFSFPFKEWLRGPLGPSVEQVFDTSAIFRDHWLNRAFCRALLREHQSGYIDHAPRLWLLYSVARWYDRWIA